MTCPNGWMKFEMKDLTSTLKNIVGHKKVIFKSFLEINKFIASRTEVFPAPFGPMINRFSFFKSRSNSLKSRKFLINTLAMDIS